MLKTSLTIKDWDEVPHHWVPQSFCVLYHQVRCPVQQQGHLLFASFLCLSCVRSSLLIHADFPPPCLTSCTSGWAILELRGGDCWKSVCSGSKFLYWAVTHSVLPKKSLNWPRPALLMSKVVSPLSSTFPSEDSETHHLMDTGAEVGPSRYIPNYFYLVHRSEVQQCVSPCWLLDHLCQEVTIGVLQKLPGALYGF